MDPKSTTPLSLSKLVPRTPEPYVFLLVDRSLMTQTLHRAKQEVPVMDCGIMKVWLYIY